MARFSHLEQVAKPKYDWQNNLMTTALMKKAFSNPITANLLNAVQEILVESMIGATKIRTYFRP